MHFGFDSGDDGEMMMMMMMMMVMIDNDDVYLGFQTSEEVYGGVQ